MGLAMNVKGVEITAEQVAAMSAAMTEQFRSADIIAAAEEAGVPKGEIAMRAADRIVQQQRKAGKIQIVKSGPYWALVS
jgi:hypothetical protein